jgi:simple sugar transport system permease protein
VGFLKARWDVNEIIVTLMFTYAAIRITDYLVQGPMQGASGALSGTALIPPAAQVPSLSGTRLHFGVVLTVLATIAIWFLISRTIYGYKITMTGSNEHATESAGMDKGRLYILVFVLGGALAGLAGIIEIAGVQGRLRSTFSPGYGFTAIPIALLGRNGAFQVLLAATFFALLFIGGQNIVVTQGVPSSLIEIIQALVILFLITAEFFKSYKIDIEWGNKMSSSTSRFSTGDD